MEWHVNTAFESVRNTDFHRICHKNIRFSLSIWHSRQSNGSHSPIFRSIRTQMMTIIYDEIGKFRVRNRLPQPFLRCALCDNHISKEWHNAEFDGKWAVQSLVRVRFSSMAAAVTVARNTLPVWRRVHSATAMRFKLERWAKSRNRKQGNWGKFIEIFWNFMRFLHHSNCHHHSIIPPWQLSCYRCN